MPPKKDWNPAAEIMFGFTRDEAVGHFLNDLIVPPDKIEEERQIQRDARERELAVYESVRRRKDGSLVHVAVSTKAIRDGADGKVEYFLSTKKDVTHLKVKRDSKLVETTAPARNIPYCWAMSTRLRSPNLYATTRSFASITAQTSRASIGPTR